MLWDVPGRYLGFRIVMRDSGGTLDAYRGECDGARQWPECSRAPPVWELTS